MILISNVRISASNANKVDGFELNSSDLDDRVRKDGKSILWFSTNWNENLKLNKNSEQSSEQSGVFGERLILEQGSVAGLTQLKSTCGPCFLASSFSVQSIILRIGLIALLFVLCFWAKSGKCYSKKHVKFLQLWKERTVIALGFYMNREKLQLRQTSVNILIKHVSQI